MAKKTSLPVYVVAFCLFLGGVGYMAWTGFSENNVYFLTVSEALDMPGQELKAARLFGTVSGEDLTRPSDGLGVRFRLLDATKPGTELWVEYTGVVPDTFKPGAEVIVEGAMADGGFFAKTLMTKCPSKYQKENRTEATRV
ncbi:MAG TPA: cytochrome c maturation protein CcmE [Candidatus Mailhella merdavium]|nr:cytochrome c maturation protein CcmE [Candidatus Mailhella merdavium]